MAGPATRSLQYMLFSFLVLATPAGAASFDCSTAKTLREKLICSDKTLSQLDDQIGHIYQEKKATISAHGAELLQRSEQSWLHYIGVVCPLEPKPENQVQRTSLQCLQGEYRQRLDALANVGKKIGPFVFNRIDLFSVRPSKDDTGSNVGFLVQHVSYPQIDNPDTPQAEAWNKQAKRNLPARDCEDCDADLDYAIGYATDKFISMSWTFSFYGHGAAHGSWTITNDNFVLRPTLRRIRSADVFSPGPRVSKKLQDLFFNALEEQEKFSTNDDERGQRSEMSAIIASADRWLFTNQGLEIRFNAYEGGCYACTPDPVTIKWTDLKSLFAADSIVP